MKPVYDECSLKWRVKGVGLFNTPQEAWNAIRDNEKSHMLNLLVSRKMMNDLRAVADKRNISVSELVRQAVRKEVNDNGN